MNLAFERAAEFVNKTFNPTEMEKNLAEALSNENWGVSNTIKMRISDGTFDYREYPNIMKALWEALQSDTKRWRVIFKALGLLE